MESFADFEWRISISGNYGKHFAEGEKKQKERVCIRSIFMGRLSRGDVFMKKGLKGSFMIEAAYIIPVIFFVIATAIFLTFFFHDKALLSGAAYESVSVASRKAREKGGITTAEIEAFCVERLGGKLIFFSAIQIEAGFSGEEIEVSMVASKGKINLRISEKALITIPETSIRNMSRIRKTLEGK